MDEEELRVDIADALGKATAVICIQVALLATLVNKKVLTKDEAATLTALANQSLEVIPGVSDDVKMIAESTLRGFAKTWTKHVTRN
jgi:hypothetical protein